LPFANLPFAILSGGIYLGPAVRITF